MAPDVFSEEECLGRVVHSSLVCAATPTQHLHNTYTACTPARHLPFAQEGPGRVIRRVKRARAYAAENAGGGPRFKHKNSGVRKCRPTWRVGGVMRWPVRTTGPLWVWAGAGNPWPCPGRRARDPRYKDLEAL